MMFFAVDSAGFVMGFDRWGRFRSSDCRQNRDSRAEHRNQEQRDAPAKLHDAPAFPGSFAVSPRRPPQREPALAINHRTPVGVDPSRARVTLLAGGATVAGRADR
jgi:hypothetical protein